MAKLKIKSEKRSLSVIASEIKKDWGVKVNYAAKPYLDVMGCIDSKTDNIGGGDTGQTVINYFLCNASTWRGEVAKRIKLELKSL